jgi:hypothetical protein
MRAPQTASVVRAPKPRSLNSAHLSFVCPTLSISGDAQRRLLHAVVGQRYYGALRRGVNPWPLLPTLHHPSFKALRVASL